MKKDFFGGKLEKMTHILEVIISVVIASAVIIGLLDLVGYFPEILNLNGKESYELFQDFLSHALLLIVGVELILMIINQTTKGILELILYVIARKMLIYAHTMLDLVLGTVAIAIVFVILKFLIPTNNDGKLEEEENKELHIEDG